MSVLHIADTGFFVALGAPDNQRYRRVRTFAQRNGIVFAVPERVHEELTPTGTSDSTEIDAIPVDAAIDDGWIRVCL